MNATPDMPILETRALSRSFGGIHALQGVDFKLPRGQLRGVIGPNGAGKTTFFNAITGILRPTAGEILLEGRPITGLAPRRIAMAGLARTFQLTSIFGGMSVYENVWAGAQARRPVPRSIWSGRQRRAIGEKVDSILALMQLDALRDQIAAEISYGDQRVLEIAIALASEPKLLLLDEPTQGMSADETGRIVDLLGRLRGSISIVLIEHDMEVVMGVADIVTVLDQGRHIAEGSPAEVQADPLVRKVYLGT